MANTNLKQRYKDEVIQQLREKFDYKNPLEIPKLEKIVINMGMGEASMNVKYLDAGVKDLTMISGQKPIVTRAKKSIATFKIRTGMPVGAMVTLRGQRMYDFFQKLVCVALPRIRDFRGLSLKGIDKQGNLTLGFKEHIVFPEIKSDEIERIHGLEISVTTDANDHAKGLEMFKLLGFPFQKIISK